MNLERISRRGVLAVTAGAVGTVGSVRTTSTAEAGGTNENGTTSHIVIFGGSPDSVIEYGLTVSGRLQKSGRSGGASIADRYITVDGEDSISNRGRHASGAVAGGGDAYRFTGRITRFRVSLSSARQNEVGIYLDGRKVRPDELGDAPAARTPVEFLDCNTARVTGTFRGVRLHTSFWDEAGLGTNWLFPGAVSGTTVLHPTAEHDPYPFAIDSVSLDTRKLKTPGQPAKFTAVNPYAGPWCREGGAPSGTLPNHLVIFGGSPGTVIRYEFAVSGQLAKSGDADGAPIADRYVTVDSEDELSGNRARGAVAGGGDAYRFSGDLTAFEIDGGATVYLNGRRVNPDELGGGGGGTDGGEEGDGGGDEMEDENGTRSKGIEFQGCERAVVTGDFERVTINTSWYASDGLATSYNEIGPVSGRTQIDRSNVGDVGESGFVIVTVAAYESGSAEPTISKRNPNTEACNRKLRPTTETTGTETETGTQTRETTQESETARQQTTERTTKSQETTDASSTSRESSTSAESTANSTPEATDTGGGTSGESGDGTSESGADAGGGSASGTSGSDSSASGNESA
ncbi:hypothetical protein [Haladaptatus sp. DYF46]|uniref:hypothetical protein n=1 Tax=Haladaptatus sp. DYF46 TaxID=2886041 RepID=UPI001E537EFC|nr:hypothetical protein [Haladaptatus sp. DYF46]